jgi:hypothetical protein
MVAQSPITSRNDSQSYSTSILQGTPTMAPPEATPFTATFEKSLSCLDWDLDGMDDELPPSLSEISCDVVFRDWSVQDEMLSNSSDDDEDWRVTFSNSDPFDEFGMDLDTDYFSFDPPLGDDVKDASSLPFDKRFEATRLNLEASMRRSQETRRSLTITTSHVEKYERRGSVKGVIESVENSAQKLQKCFIVANLSSNLNLRHAPRA